MVFNLVSSLFVALVTLVDDLRHKLGRGNASGIITIDHGTLMGCLSDLGVGGTFLQWKHTFLTDRSQKVVMGDCYSSP